jgi:hypothetical protein
MKKVFIALPLALAFAAAAQPPDGRPHFQDLREILVAAIDVPRGEARGVLVGDLATSVTRAFDASGSILLDVSTERRYRQPGCSRLKLTVSQEGVLLPGEATRRTKTVDVSLNYCRDGTPPHSLE